MVLASCHNMQVLYSPGREHMRTAQSAPSPFRTGTTTSAPASCSLMGAHSLWVVRPAHSPSGTWPHPRPASRPNSRPRHPPVTPWPSALMPKSASPAVAMGTLLSGTCTTRPWSGEASRTACLCLGLVTVWPGDLARWGLVRERDEWACFCERWPKDGECVCWERSPTVP